ncbi:MAG TPA: hypothetical protein VFO10_01290 [Oligoflexus sp.]|uniref:hypothetical protein n=1 Tax=Oligoflexus sp. TaxID=1971216 RepID=UPI002D7FACEE|nr:hypothetical protein [Oligoflexus sp.]HET9235851.1 hypothetical protein [Oligoflexus sp.]
MLKTSTLFVSMLLLAGCYSLNNRHDTLAVQCDINGRTQDKVLVKFTNPGGVELSREQLAQLQVQYQGTSNNQALTLTARACVALPVGAARVKAKISGDTPLSADLVLDASAATDTIHKVELEAPGVLIMGLKCPKNGLLAADSLDNLVEVKKSLGKLNGYKVDLALYNAQNEKVRSLFAKDILDESLVLPSSFNIKNVDEGTYKVELSVLDSYHDKSGAEAKSQCNLTVRRSCAKDEDFDPATVSCVPKLCDNAYRVGAKWTDNLALQRGEGRYECRLEKGQAEKVLLSHTCQGGYFKSKDSCLAAKEIAGSCALLESDEVACWGTVIGKDNYPSRRDINLQTAMKFPEKVKRFGSSCVELESKKIHCWSIVYDENASYRFMPEESTPKTWREAQLKEFVDRADPCSGITFSGGKCEFRLTQAEGVNSIQPAPNGSASCLLDVTGSVWCNKSVMPKSKVLDSSVEAAPYFRVADLPKGALQVRSQSFTTCVILIDGSVMCWGDNTTGGVGSNSSALNADKPSQTVDSKGAKLTNITQITSTLDFSGQPTNYALSKDGRVFAWGSNLDGAVANGTPGEDDEGNALFSRFAVPILVETIKSITPLAQ